MKATMPGNQILPVKLASKDSSPRKDTAAHSSVQRFDDVLSGVKAASRAAGQGKIADRPTDPLAKLPIVQAAETRRSEAEDDEGTPAEEGMISLAASHATADHPPDIAASELLPPPIMGHRSIVLAARPTPTASDVISSARNVSVASRAVREDVDEEAVPRAVAVRLLDAPPSDRTRTGKTANLGQESPPASPRRSTEVAAPGAQRERRKSLHEGDPALANAAVPVRDSMETAASGAPNFGLDASMRAGFPAARAHGADVDAPRSAPATSNVATRIGADLSTLRVAHPLEAAAMVGSRDGSEGTTSAEIPPAQPTAFATAPTRESRRAPIATTRVALPTEPAGASVDRGSPTNNRDDVTVVAQEKHFQPVTSLRDIRPPSAARIEEALETHSVPSSPAYADQKSPDAHKATTSPRVEPQPKTATPVAPPLVQVASAITQEIGDAPPEPVDPVASASAATPQMEARELLRLLKVALDPPELGRVNVRLRLTGRALEVTVTAERPETASLLDRDRHTLTKILHACGYSAEDITVQAQSVGLQANAPTLRAADPQVGNQATPQFQSGAGTEGERQSPPRPHDGGRGQSPQEMQVDDADNDPRRGGDLYV